MVESRKQFVIYKEKFVQIEITRKSLGHGLGWTMVGLFWLTIFALIVSLFSANDKSGAGMVIYGFTMLASQTFPLLIIPLGILIKGVRKEYGEPLWKVLLKWGTIATAVYLACLPLAYFVLYQ